MFECCVVTTRYIQAQSNTCSVSMQACMQGNAAQVAQRGAPAGLQCVHGCQTCTRISTTIRCASIQCGRMRSLLAIVSAALEERVVWTTKAVGWVVAKGAIGPAVGLAGGVVIVTGRGVRVAVKGVVNGAVEGIVQGALEGIDEGNKACAGALHAPFLQSPATMHMQRSPRDTTAGVPLGESAQ